MTNTINSYAAVLLITIAGAAATLFIVRATYSSTLTATFVGNEAEYLSLQQSILSQ